MTNDSIERIKAVFEELNRPSAARLKTALKQRDIPYDTKTVNEVVSKSTEKQLQLPVYNYKQGKITATAPNSRWQIDTIDLTSKPSKRKGEKDPYKYIVACVDVFTRKLMAQATTSVSPAVVAQVFEEFTAQHGVPKQLDSDPGTEFNDPRFQQVLKWLNVGKVVGQHSRQEQASRC